MTVSGLWVEPKPWHGFILQKYPFTKLDIIFVCSYLYTFSNPRYQQVIHRRNGNFKAKTVSKSADGVDKIVDKSKNFIGYFVYIIFLKLIL